MSGSSINFGVEVAANAQPGLIDWLCKRAVIKGLSSLREGRIELAHGEESWSFGDNAAPQELRARVRVNDPAFFRRISLGGSVGAGEAYMDGLWEADDLASLIRIFARNAAGSEVEGAASWLRRMADNLLHVLRKNTRAGSRRNIAAHYDLSNEFFALFLDPTMCYSAGYFSSAETTMKEASIEKIDMACRKLDLKPGESLLEIGTGWGAAAIHAAKRYGCRVTTTTISQRQHDVAAERVKKAGLENRVTLLLKDYRDLDGQYDKLLSIEMIEAVGHDHLKLFFRRCAELLKPSGLALIQAITIPDQKYDRARRETDFIKRHIFPGGFVPSIEAMASAARKATDLRLVHMHDFGVHYARTLRDWRARFNANASAIRNLGFDDRFMRMWEFYLCYCEGGFDERAIGLAQLLFARPRSRRSPIA